MARTCARRRPLFALSPGYLEAHLSVLRALVGLSGQREVLLDRLSALTIPTLVVWGARDRVFPPSQAKEAISRLREGTFALIPERGHVPHVERPDLFVAAIGEFLTGGGLVNRRRPQEAPRRPEELRGDVEPPSR